MTKRYFGTDGVRGTANTFPMTAETALRLGMAAGRHFRSTDDRRHLVVIGKDTRLSGYMIEPALVAGFTSVGMDVRLFGPLPTPGVAMMTRSLRADLGVMISASHNPYYDNGVKLFGPDGAKLDDAAELEIEAMMDAGLEDHLAAPESLGRVKRIDDAQARYVEIVKATFPKPMTLNGVRVVVDCAHGAAYKVAPAALYELGADVISIGVAPNGFNVNEGCGSTAPVLLQRTVRDHDADLGVALDGDADRVILCDETGALVDGDQILALIATQWARAGRLANAGVVSTVMSNFGLELFLKDNDIALHRTKVGDRYVTERMRSGGYNLGGEQSGHIVMSDFTTTGDGLVAALQVLADLVASGKPASQRLRQFTPLPQVLKSVQAHGAGALLDDAVRAAMEGAERRLGNHGRLVVRPSGTEPVIRVMAEGDDEDLVTAVVDDVCAAIAARAAAPTGG